ncbi:DUF371 domain-containing protein [Candidatus Thorarchaeota archaeon]|nr:DUF371 domain-containing protein [Candidatus Thorarchaeota archaeon]TFG97113.1 MAG: DUF371 domain-containing protein [Candidatus Thorarchaeota archaeon]
MHTTHFMHLVRFKAYGHENVIGEHKTTVEITTEDFLTNQGTCIVGVQATQKLSDLSSDIRELVTLETTKIVLLMKVAGIQEQVIGTGGKNLTYSDSTSMVARTSSFQCGRTLMINADKAASDLNREFVNLLAKEGREMICELHFIPE